MEAQPKLSKLQKHILQQIAESESGIVRIASLYNPSASNLKSTRSALSRAVGRLADRGLIEKLSLQIPGLERRRIPAVRIASART